MQHHFVPSGGSAKWAFFHLHLSARAPSYAWATFMLPPSRSSLFPPRFGVPGLAYSLLLRVPFVFVVCSSFSLLHLSHSVVSVNVCWLSTTTRAVDS